MKLLGNKTKRKSQKRKTTFGNGFEDLEGRRLMAADFAMLADFAVLADVADTASTPVSLVVASTDNNSRVQQKGDRGIIGSKADGSAVRPQSKTGGILEERDTAIAELQPQVAKEADRTNSDLERRPMSAAAALGDLNDDGEVNFADFLILSNNFGAKGSDLSPADGDTNGDQAVDFADFLTLSTNFGKSIDEFADAVRLDQDGSTYESSGNLVVSDRHVLAQTFTAGESGALGRVSLNIRQYQNSHSKIPPGDLVIQIRSTSLATVDVFGGNSGQTTALAPAHRSQALETLAREQVDASRISSTFSWLDVDFSQPAMVAKGETYAIVLTKVETPGSDAETETHQYSWSASRSDQDDQYPVGMSMSRRADSGRWSISTRPAQPNPIYGDYLFQTYLVAGSFG